MGTGGIILLLLIIGFPIYLVAGCIYEYRKTVAKEKREQAEAEAWLAEEMKQPMFKAVITTKGGKTFETDPREPMFIPHWYSGSPIRISSKELVQSSIKDIFKAEYFNENGTYIPLCEIEYIEVVQA